MTDRLDRKNYTREEALQEIAMAELILDGMGAEKGMTLWGRIASYKDTSLNLIPPRNPEETAAMRWLSGYTPEERAAQLKWAYYRWMQDQQRECSRVSGE